MWILSENEGSPLLGPQQRSAKMAVKYGEGYTEKYQGKGLVSHQSGLVKFHQSGLSSEWSITFHRVVFHLVGLIKFHQGGLCSGVAVHCQAGIQCKR